MGSLIPMRFFPRGSAVSGNKVGYAVGANNVSIKGEFLYSQFGKVTATGEIVNFFNPNFTNTFATSARVQEYTGRVGLNYRFDWLAPGPVVAKY